MSKLMTETMLADTARAHPINYCALRYFNVAGADPEARTGQSTAGATHLIKVAVEAALGKRSHVGVFGTDFATPDGTGVRDYIHVSDLAAAHVLALDALIEAPDRSLTMNCGYGQGFSVLQVLDAVDRVTEPDHRAPDGGPPRRRSRFADFGQQPDQAGLAVGAALCRSGCDRTPCAGVGTQTDRDPPGHLRTRLTFTFLAHNRRVQFSARSASGKRDFVMKIRNSLKSLKDRHRDNRVIRRRGRTYVINKTQKRFKARQG